jgi:hypothetical protein
MIRGEAEMDIGRLIEELIIPLLLYGFFSFCMIANAVSAIKTVREINREGVTVSAEITGYSEGNFKLGRLRQKAYSVTVSCIDPRTNIRADFTLTTNSSKGQRYADTKKVDIIFLKDQKRRPLLPENLNTAKRIRFTALFGGIFCFLFCTLLMICIIVMAADGRLSR